MKTSFLRIGLALAIGLFSLSAFAQAQPAHTEDRIDFNGDGRTDVAVFTPNNEWWVGLSSGADFGANGGGHWASPVGLWGEIPLAGDFNGDSKTDVAVFNPHGQWWVGVSAGTAFTATGSGQWASPVGLWGEIPLTGDFNGDSNTDVAVFNRSGQWWVGLSTGAAFNGAGSGRWASPVGLWGEIPLTGDFNGDRKTDVAVFNPSNQWWVGLSSGAAFTATGSGQWASPVGLWGEIPLIGDFNGDSNTDVAVFNRSGQWWVGLSTGAAFNGTGSGHWAAPAGVWGQIPLTGDFNGDSRTDVAVFTPNNQWWVGLSTGSGFSAPGGGGGQWASPAGMWCELPVNIPAFLRYISVVDNSLNPWPGLFPTSVCRPSKVFLPIVIR